VELKLIDMTGERITCNAGAYDLAIQDQWGSDCRQAVLLLEANAGGSIRLCKAAFETF
jgi:hypothetical protein